MWKIALIASSALALAALPSNAQWKTPWTYDGERGAEHWGALDPDYAACNAGHAQSPVDIKGAVKRPLPPLGFDYHAGPVSLINNGATAVRVDYPRGTGDLLKVGDRIYALTQFHFHHPSEETLNGQVFAMTLHLMHASADGRVAGVAIFLKPGKANPVVQALWLVFLGALLLVVPGVLLSLAWAVGPAVAAVDDAARAAGAELGRLGE